MYKNQKTYSFFDKKDCIKLIRIMKLTFLLTLVAILQVSAETYSQSTKLTMKVNSATVQELISMIEAQSDFTVFYKDNQLDASMSVNLNMKNATIAEVLNSAFANTNLAYKVLDKIIVITNKGQLQNAITGKITSAVDGAPLPGVNVSVKGTTVGTVSDIDGNYSLDADATSTLVFSFMGYITQEVAVNSQTVVNVSLAEDTKGIEEVVVVGYGVKKKSLVTGAISSVGGEDVIASVSRAEEVMQGKASGVTVLANSGAPGTGMNVRIRGVGSNQKSEPLYIVDGMKTGDINYLAPEDIESMEILKDAASSAIYGTEGANGVVIIKTKSGKKGKSEINYTFQYGTQSLNKAPKTMDAFQYATYMNEAGIKDSPNPADFAPGSGTNWFDAASEKAPMQKHYLSFTGGSEKGAYMISAGYSKQDGIFGGNKASFERFTTRLNATQQVKDWLEVGVNFSYSNSNRASITEFDGFNSLIGSMYKMDPTTKPIYAPSEITPWMQTQLDAGNLLVKDDNGNYYGISDNNGGKTSFVGGETFNPLLQLHRSKGLTKDNKILSSGYVKLSPFKGFTFTSRVGMDLAFQNFNTWNPSYWASSDGSSNSAGVTDNDQKWSTWLWENFATYSKSFGNHNLSLMAGMSAQEYTHTTLNTSSGLMLRELDEFRYPDYITLRAGDVNGGLYEKTRMASYFGRLSYDFSGKYLFEATVRRDGSSLFGPNNKWGNFPSFSAGWLVSNEKFWTIDALSYAKIRASWGKNGSISNLGIDQYRSLITSTNINNPDGNGVLLTGAEPNLIANPDLQWEASQQTDFGLDLRALNDRLSFTFDYYKKLTKNLITGSRDPLSLGNYLPSKNLGDVENTGFEFSIGMKDKAKDFTYDVNFNISFLQNKVTKLNGNAVRTAGAVLPTIGSISYMEEGQPIWYFRGFETDGIFESQTQIDQWLVDNQITGGYTPKPGDPIVKNNKKDGLVNDDDMVNIGNPNPKIAYGGNITVGYKGFDLNVFLQGVAGVDNFMAFNRADRATYNQLAEFYDGRWTPTATTGAKYPRAGYVGNNFLKSDLMVQSGAYLKIRQIQLGYTLPQAISSKAKISNARVYVSLNDFFTFSKYPGLDPEIGSNSSNAVGVDYGTYPIARKLLFGLSVTF